MWAVIRGILGTLARGARALARGARGGGRGSWYRRRYAFPVNFRRVDYWCYRAAFRRRMGVLIAQSGRERLSLYVPKLSGELRNSAFLRFRAGGAIEGGFDTPYSHFIRFNGRGRRNAARRLARIVGVYGSSHDCHDAVRRYMASGHLRKLERRAHRFAVRRCPKR